MKIQILNNELFPEALKEVKGIYQDLSDEKTQKVFDNKFKKVQKDVQNYDSKSNKKKFRKGSIIFF